MGGQNVLVAQNVLGGQNVSVGGKHALTGCRVGGWNLHKGDLGSAAWGQSECAGGAGALDGLGHT